MIFFPARSRFLVNIGANARAGMGVAKELAWGAFVSIFSEVVVFPEVVAASVVGPSIVSTAVGGIVETEAGP